jgi:hypothetical protein
MAENDEVNKVIESAKNWNPGRDKRVSVVMYKPVNEWQIAGVFSMPANARKYADAIVGCEIKILELTVDFYLNWGG